MSGGGTAKAAFWLFGPLAAVVVALVLALALRRAVAAMSRTMGLLLTLIGGAVIFIAAARWTAAVGLRIAGRAVEAVAEDRPGAGAILARVLGQDGRGDGAVLAAALMALVVWLIVLIPAAVRRHR